MSRYINHNRPPSAEVATLIGALIAIGLVAAVGAIGQAIWPAPVESLESTPVAVVLVETAESQGPEVVEIATVNRVTATATPTREPKPTSSPIPTLSPTREATPTFTPIPPSPTPTHTRTPTATPTPTLDLSACNAAGCGPEAAVLPTVEYDTNLLLRQETPARRDCEECPPNEQLSEAELETLIAADRDTLDHLWAIALSQETYEIAPGIVYLVFDNAHHVVIDLAESGYILRNIIPHPSERGTLITPSYCLSSRSLVVIDADYHGLDGSNKTETGQDIFFHLGRAALFKRAGQFDLDVIRERDQYDQTTISWGGGPIFIWHGRYDFDPEQEWFDTESLEYYRDTRWAKMTVALSEDRKYLFITASFDLTLREHAQNIINLGEKWGIKIDRAMRFDGGESAYLAFRLGDYLAPILDLEEPLIVNCLAVERDIDD